MKRKPDIHQNVSTGFKRTIAYLDNLMVAVCEFTDGPSSDFDPAHSHEHEQITYVADGELIFRLEGEDYHLRKGDIISVPSKKDHCIKKLTNRVILIDSFSPVRNDFL
jgi:quercetin dioxygenase-like cupin family protein